MFSILPLLSRGFSQRCIVMDLRMTGQCPQETKTYAHGIIIYNYPNMKRIFIRKLLYTTTNKVRPIWKEGVTSEVESTWNLMAHGDAREGKWRGNWRMQWVSSTLHTTSEHYRWCTHLGCPVVDWTDDPADLNGLVRFTERRNVVSARVPSHFNVV